MSTEGVHKVILCNVATEKAKLALNPLSDPIL